MTRARFTLRRAKVADAPAMWDIRAEAIRVTCRSRYPEAMLARWAATPMPGTIVANIERGYFTAGILESSIAGFAAINVAAAEIEALFVAPAYSGLGLGQQLLAHLERAAIRKRMPRLELNSSLNAVTFYQAHGYHAGEPTSYTNSIGIEVACVRMEKRLGGAKHRSA
jgi:GNAT superfamily N-acetyltransferase